MAASRRGASRRPAREDAPQTAGARAGASTRTPVRRRVGAYLASHARAAVFTLGRLARAPGSSGLTVMVVAIALALPGGLHLLIQNLSRVSAGWEGSAEVSLFLEQSVSDRAASALAQGLGERDDVAAARAISRDQALAEFRRLSGFGEALEVLDRNPLPAVVVLRPVRPAVAESMVGELRELPEVDHAQLDREWLRRLQAILNTMERAILVIGVLLGAGVILIVGNTIRLDIQNHRREIEISKLIGATDAFIRRPFLYTGIWYGIAGGVLAVLLVLVALYALHGPAARLASLYDARSPFGGLDAATVAVLLGGGPLLGWAGAWLAVGRHLREIEPQ